MNSSRKQVVQDNSVFLAETGHAGTTSSHVSGGSASVAGIAREGGPDADVLRGGVGDDTLSGLGGDDRLLGKGGDDMLDGGAGDDYLVGGVGHNTIVGGDGVDTLSAADAIKGVEMGMSNEGSGSSYYSFFFGSPFDESYQDSFTGIENLVGSRFADTIAGNSSANHLWSGGGSDTIYGGGGDDVIELTSSQTQYARNVSRPDLVKTADTANHSMTTALLVDTREGGDFDTDFDPAITTPVVSGYVNSLVVPHATIQATTKGGTTDYYAIHLEANAVLAIDPDDYRLADGTSGRLRIIFRDAEGNKLGTYALDGEAFSDTGPSNFDPGDTPGFSTEALAFAPTTGTYYIEIQQSLAFYETPFLPEGATYTLNLSTISASVTPTEGTQEGYSLIVGGDSFGMADPNAHHGNDTVSFRAATGGVTVDLSNDVQQTGGAGLVQLYQIDNITGSDHADRLTGDDRANVLTGLRGADVLTAGAGDDTVDGGAGRDRIVGGVGFDVLAGGSGSDVVFAGRNDDAVEGGDGNDRLYGQQGADVLRGGAGDDVIDGGFGDEFEQIARPVIVKPASQDISSTATAIVLDARGADTDFSLAYDPNIDQSRAIPHASIDAVSSGTAAGPVDQLGYYGDYYGVDVKAGETVTFDVDANVLSDGTPFDVFLRLYHADGTFVIEDSVAGPVPVTRFPAFGENVFDDPGSNSGSATLTYTFAEAGRYYISVADFNETDNLLPAGAQYRLNVSLPHADVESVTGHDTIDGGLGSDTASYAAAASAVTVDLSRQGSAQDIGGGGHDLLTGIENLVGSNFADTLAGDRGANVLTGGKGADTLTGGLGADIFRYTDAGDSTLSARDTITDFRTGVDTIDLTGLRIGAADRLQVTSNGDNSFVRVDLGGDGAFDLRIDVHGAITTSDVLWGAAAASGLHQGLLAEAALAPGLLALA